MEKKNKIDVSLITARDRKNLSITFLGAVKRFYENPENIRRFEEWKKEQEAGDAAEVTQEDKTKQAGGLTLSDRR